MRLSELEDGALVMDCDGRLWELHGGKWVCTSWGWARPTSAALAKSAPLTLLVRGETLEDGRHVAD